MLFDLVHVPAIEHTLQEQLPDRWRQLTGAESAWKPLKDFCAAWRISTPAGSVRWDGIDHLVLVVDAAFPNSQPRVFAPQAGSSLRWPHVEADGLLCLKPTRLFATPGDRVLQHLRWAEELLNYSDDECRREFEREFLSYWGRRSSNKKGCFSILSLNKPGGESREILYYEDKAAGRIVTADDKLALVSWLRNSGTNPVDREILPTELVRLPRPWIPGEYPEHGSDVLHWVPESILRGALARGRVCPLLFEAATTTGPAFAAALLQGAAERDLVKGFRRIGAVPTDRIRALLVGQSIQRCRVSRVDGPWIHGRGHDDDYPVLRGKYVALVGCGSLGGAAVRLLAQAGVGKFLLIDPDDLTPANVSRHALGMRSVGQNKAQAVAEMLRRDYPHIDTAKSYVKRFQDLTESEFDTVSRVDLVLSAGIDFDGDASLDAWRRNLAAPPAHLCAWVEAYAIVGHAVLLYGADSLLAGFDENEQPLFRLTDWPEESAGLLVEAGCGNGFQPHGAVDLQPTVAMASRLAIDVLLGNVPASCRRVWQGDQLAVATNGGIAMPEFGASNVARELPWR